MSKHSLDPLLRARIDSIDANPVIATADGAFAVDALVSVRKQPAPVSRNRR